MATVQDCINGIKWQTDLQVGGRLVDADLIPEIDAAHKQAWETVVQAYEDHYIKKVPADAVIAGGVGLNTIALPADFFKMKGLQRQIGNGVFAAPLPTHEFNEVGAVAELSYRINDDTIYIEPEMSCSGTYRVWYVYSPVDLTAVGNPILDKTNGAVKRFIIDLVSMRVASREEEDPSLLEKLKNEMLERIRLVAGNRNAGRGKKIADVRRTNRWRFMTRSGRSLP